MRRGRLLAGTECEEGGGQVREVDRAGLVRVAGRGGVIVAEGEEHRGEVAEVDDAVVVAIAQADGGLAGIGDAVVVLVDDAAVGNDPEDPPAGLRDDVDLALVVLSEGGDVEEGRGLLEIGVDLSRSSALECGAVGVDPTGLYASAAVVGEEVHAIEVGDRAATVDATAGH